MESKKILVDVSSVLGQFMHIKDEEFGEDMTSNGETFHIPHHDTLMERAEAHFQDVLQKLKHGPEALIMVRDPEKPGEARKKKFPDYKQGRQKRPKRFYEVFNKFCDSFCDMVMKEGGITATPRVVPTVEADDLINELAARLPDTIIFSADKDLLSCPAGAHYIGGELNPIKYPVPNKFIKLYRALVTGDNSDNIPSCKGFGAAAWTKMFEAVGPGGIEELDDIVAKRELHLLDGLAFPKAGMLIEQAETIYKAYELMTFLHVPAHKIKWEGRCPEATSVLVTASNFTSALAAVKTALKTEPHAVIDFETSTCEESDIWKEGTKNDDGKGGVGVDVMASEITGMGLKVGPMAWYFSVEHKDTDNITLQQLGSVLELLKDKTVYAHNSTGFENPVLYNHFGFFLEGMLDTRLMASYVDENDRTGLKHLSSRWLGYEQTTYAEVMGDRQHMRELTGKEVFDYGIDDVLVTDALANLFTVIMQYERSYDVFVEVEKDSAFVTSIAFVTGIEFDAEIHAKLRKENDEKTARLRAELEQMLLDHGMGEKEFVPVKLLTLNELRRAFEIVYKGALPSAGRSVKTSLAALRESPEWEGSYPIPFSVFVNMAETGEEELNALVEPYWTARAELNVRSPKQMSELMYTVLRLPVRVRNQVTDKMRERGQYEGNPATDDTAIENAIAWKDTDEAGIKLLETLQEYKGCLTRESLFLSKWPKYVHWKTGKVHMSVTQCGTTTRRFAHSSPNCGQLPKRKGKEVRSMVKAPEMSTMHAHDVDSQELKLAAWHTQDENFLACYTGPKKDRKDVHGLTGYSILLKKGDDVYGSFDNFKKEYKGDNKEATDSRALGKKLNFTCQFGAKKRKVSLELCCTETDADLFMQARDDAFPGVAPAIAAWNKLCRKRRYSTTFMGARRHLARDYAAKSQGDLEAADRLSFSFAIQGSAAEQIKMAMGRLWRSGILKDGLTQFIVTIHDELVLSSHNSVLAERIKITHDCLCQKYADMELETGSTPEAGTHFGSLKEFKMEEEA